MSKIFDAYKKQVQTEASDLTRGVPQGDTLVLFPKSEAKQNEEFSKLANRLLGLRMETQGAVISFASSAAGEGASFVSYHTASALARDYDQKVVWVDANFLAPQKRLNGLSLLSFSSLIRDPKKAQELLPTGNLTLVPGGDNLVGARGYFAGNQYHQLLKAFRQKFDFVIMDLPPVLKSTDAALLAGPTDGFLLVVEQRFLKWEVINHGLDSLKEKKVKVLGSVINRRKFDLPKVLYDRL
ncbi:hypothetical protein CSB20_11595 [bacterium DOLZORAL124_64_63]|nr:MAG: hypothetical protein CSB20_11595 [bacterium DOLZORAL124_64_63]